MNTKLTRKKTTKVEMAISFVTRVKEKQHIHTARKNAFTQKRNNDYLKIVQVKKCKMDQTTTIKLIDQRESVKTCELIRRIQDDPSHSVNDSHTTKQITIL